MDALHPSRQTFGEQIVSRLLRQLPSAQYFHVAEPAIQSRNGTKYPDFILVARQLGVVVIEVKDWKELMGGDQRHVTVRRSDGTVVEFDNPVWTARNYALDLTDKFKEYEELLQLRGGKSKLAFPWQHSVVLTHISQDTITQFERANVFPSGIIFGREQLSDAATFEDALVKLPWKFSLKPPLGQDVLDVIRSIIDPTIIVRSPQGEVIGVESYRQEKLIREIPEVAAAESVPTSATEIRTELGLLVRDIATRRIRGVAGSGKTLVLERRAQFLRKNFPRQRILVLVYNKDLSTRLRNRIHDNTIEVKTFHALCREIIGSDWSSPIQIEGWLKSHARALIGQNGLTVNFVAEEIQWRKGIELFSNETYLTIQRSGRGSKLSRSKREVINQIFDNYTEFQNEQNATGGEFYDWQDVPLIVHEILNDDNDPHPLRQAYDHILLDEAQDFAPTWVKVIKLLLKTGGTLLICDDATQSLFNSFSWKEKGLNVVGRTTVLEVPFRSTREIMRAAFSLVEADAILSRSEELTRPRLNISELRTGQLPILARYENWGAEQASVQEAVERLIDEGMLPECIGVLCCTTADVKAFANLSQRGVYVAAYGKMKGLEFDAVFLPHLNKAFDTFDEEADEYSVSKNRRRIYVAMTRARDTLVLSYHTTWPDELKPLDEFVELVKA